jgi:hypothetical protein
MALCEIPKLLYYVHFVLKTQMKLYLFSGGYLSRI